MNEQEKRDKVIKELENYEPYAKGLSNVTVKSSVILNAIALLKEQEPVKPKSKVRHGAYGQIQHWCGNCMKMLNGKPKYCSECGREIRWG